MERLSVQRVTALSTGVIMNVPPFAVSYPSHVTVAAMQLPTVTFLN